MYQVLPTESTSTDGDDIACSKNDMEISVVPSCSEKDIKDTVLDLPIHDNDISKETSSLQEVPSDTNVGETSFSDPTHYEESTLNKKNDVNICSTITETVHEESLNLHNSESIKDSKEDTISKLNGSVMESINSSSDMQMKISENVETTQGEEAMIISSLNTAVTDANEGSNQAGYLDGKEPERDEKKDNDNFLCLSIDTASPEKPLPTDISHIESNRKQEISKIPNLPQESTNLLDFSISSNKSPNIKRDKLDAQLGG